MKIDYAVIGGSFAGLSAALMLARARRQVLVVDAGQRRNRFVDQAQGTSHGFLGHDGRAPAAIAGDGKAQLLRYPSVQWLDAQAVQARLTADGRIAFNAGDTPVSAGRLILATGVSDELPPIPGLQERWGGSVFHCPYCHGYEMNAGRIGVIAATPQALHHASMLPDWGRTTFFLNDVFTPSEDERAALAGRGVHVEHTPIERIAGIADVVLRDGRTLAMDGLFTQPRTRMASTVAQDLGCRFEQGPMGPYIQVSATQESSVPGVFACGDAARGAGNVALAVADGALAGFGAHRSTLF